MPLSLENTLEKYGNLAVISIKNDVSHVSATGKTADSVKFRLFKKGTTWHLQVVGRAFFSALETGRGPRKGSEYQEFDLSMLEYMKAKGIGSDLPEKKQKQLARFLTLKINREGDSVFKKGGRQVYSENLSKLIDELKVAIANDFSNFVLSEIKHEFNRK